MQTSDIVWCNTKSPGIELSHCIFFFNKLEPGEWVYTRSVSCMSSIFNLLLRALKLDLSHLWTTALVISHGHDTLKEEPSFGRELEKGLWQLFSIHNMDPIGNTLSLSSTLHQSGLKQGRSTSPSSKTNESHLLIKNQRWPSDGPFLARWSPEHPVLGDLVLSNMVDWTIYGGPSNTRHSVLLWSIFCDLCLQNWANRSLYCTTILNTLEKFPIIRNTQLYTCIKQMWECNR